MSEIKLFENSMFGSIRVLPEGDSFWVVGKDVLKALDYSEGSIRNASDMFSSIPSEWTGTKPICISSSNGVVQTREMLCLSEQGLYFFLGRSDKPKALPYQKWIAGEVVPSIRKSGKYTLIEKPTFSVDFSLTDRITAACAIFKSAEIEGNQLTLALDKIHVRLTGESVLQIAGVNLIAPQQTQLYTPTQIGRSTNPVLSAVKINKILESLNWQVKTESGWEATETGKPYAVYLDTGKAHSDGTPVRQLKWTADAIFAVQSQLNEN